MPTTLADRFEAKVDRSGHHHLWTGAPKADGTGQVRVGGKLMTAARVAWELAHGPLPPGARVNRCPGEPACVRPDHLSLGGGEGTAAPPSPVAGTPSPKAGRSPRRATRGGGAKQELRPGV